MTFLKKIKIIANKSGTCLGCIKSGAHEISKMIKYTIVNNGNANFICPHKGCLKAQTHNLSHLKTGQTKSTYIICPHCHRGINVKYESSFVSVHDGKPSYFPGHYTVTAENGTNPDWLEG